MSKKICWIQSSSINCMKWSDEDNKYSNNHIIQYNLFGIVTQNSFLMFDFMNPNGTIQTIALLEAVLN